LFDARSCVVLKTPNHCLDMMDIPPRANRPVELDESVEYPGDVRYTLQWLDPPDRIALLVTPSNVDATFKKYTRKPKPSALLLHYNYGAAAVNRWGHGKEVLKNNANPAHPRTAEKVLLGPSKVVHDRSIAINKRKATRGANEAGSTNTATGDQPSEMVELRDQTGWDADEIVLFFWGNSPAAMERHRKKEEEKSEYME